MKMEDHRFSERNRCDAHEILATSVEQKAGANAWADKNTATEYEDEQQQVPSKEYTAAYSEEMVQKIHSLASDDNTHLRLDTVVNIKSDVSDSVFIAEEKKDDDDNATPSATPEGAAPETEENPQNDTATPNDGPASEPELAAEAKIDGAGDVAKEDGEKEELAKEDEPSGKSEMEARECDAVLSKEEKEQSAKVEATKAEQEAGGEGQSEKVADGTQDVAETGNVPTESVDSDWRTMPMESVDSDRPMGEAAFTAKQTDSELSDKPTQALNVWSADSTFDVATEKATKTVQFAEDTILTKDGGSKVDTMKVVEPTSESVGFFSCGSLCGSTFDATDDGDKETDSLVFKVASPEEEAATSKTVTVETNAETEEAMPADAPKSEAKPEDAKAAMAVLDEDKVGTNMTAGNIQNNRAAVDEKSQPEARPVAADSSTVKHDDGDAIVEDDKRAGDLQQSTTFEVQLGRGCSAFLACGDLSSQCTKSQRNLSRSSSHDSIKSHASHESIFDLREAAERELEERTNLEARLAAESVPAADVQEQCPEHRVESDEQQTEASVAVPPDEPAVPEESVPEREKSSDSFKPEANEPAAEENGQTTKDERQPANQEQSPAQWKNAQPASAEQPAAVQSVEQPAKPPALADTAAASPVVLSIPEQPAAIESKLKQPSTAPQEQPAAGHSVEQPAKPLFVDTAAASPAVSSIPAGRDIVVLAEEDNLARKAQQEAYACGCTIL